MAGIGDYVHLHTMNYIRQGTARYKGGGLASDFSGVLLENHQNLVTQINKNIRRAADAKALSKILTAYTYGLESLNVQDDANLGIDPETRDQLLDLVASLTTEVLYQTKVGTKTHENAQYISREVINSALTRYTNSIVSTAKINKNLNTLNISQKRLSAILKKFQEARNEVLNACRKGSIPSDRVAILQADYEKNFKEYMAIEKNLIAILESNDASKRALKTADGNGTELRAQLETIFELFKLVGGQYLFDASGPAFENFLAVVGSSKQMMVGNTMLDFQKSLVNNLHSKTFRMGDVITGQMLVAGNLPLSDFATYDWRRSADGQTSIDGSAFKYNATKTNPTQMATDLVFYKDRVPDAVARAMGDIQQLNISAKNYSSADARGIHILDSTSLYNILGLLNVDFVNHYLNLIACVKDLRGFPVDAEITGNVNQAIEEIKFALLVRGLTGARDASFNTPDNLLADCLIVNDRQKSVVKVINIADVLNKYKRATDVIHGDLNNIAQFSNVQILAGDPWGKWGHEIVNGTARDRIDRYLAAKERISKYIGAMHAGQLSLSVTLKLNNI